MKKTFCAVSLLLLPAVTMAAERTDVTEIAPASPHSLSGNVTLASEYLYRGIAQTNGKPALQGGFDYAHDSGLYAGVWASSISWLGDAAAGVSAPLEMDVYAGLKGSAGDLAYDVGVLTYNYPGSYQNAPAGFTRPDTTEVYGALSWQWVSLKYSQVVSSHVFGFTTASGGKTRGSGYLDLSLAYELGNGWGLNAHAGHQQIKGLGDASYGDYRLGLTRNVGFGLLGLTYSATDAKGDAGQPYRNIDGRDLGAERLVVSFTRSF